VGCLLTSMSPLSSSLAASATRGLLSSMTACCIHSISIWVSFTNYHWSLGLTDTSFPRLTLTSAQVLHDHSTTTRHIHDILGTTVERRISISYTWHIPRQGPGTSTKIVRTKTYITYIIDHEDPYSRPSRRIDNQHRRNSNMGRAESSHIIFDLCS
jgi:hypothetical protein